MMTNKNKKYLICLLMFMFLQTSLIVHASRASFDQHTPPDVRKDFELLRDRVKRNPRDVAAINSLGIIYANAGQLEDAIKLWQYGMGIRPDYIHLYNNLGSALKQKGRREEAKMIFKAGLMHERSHLIYYNLGTLEKDDQNLAKAAEYFKYCLEICPDFQPAIQQLEQLGYFPKMAAKNTQIPTMTLGSYKPPVEIGNIELTPIYPSGIQQEKSESTSKSTYKKPNTTIKQFKPLSYDECCKIIRSLEAPAHKKYVALTFDDGPHHSLTPEILNILRDEGAKGTFFVVGNRAETYPDLISQIAAEGHDIGNHTWNHLSLAKNTTETGLKSLRKTNDLITGLTGKRCNIVRPPYGATSARVRSMLQDNGWHQILWDSDSRDWQNKNPDVILYRVMKSLEPGGIILFHDIHPGAAKMLPTLIRALKSEGYRCVTISELIALKHAS
ncbi:MAG: polysaccharide deacetylase family protein [Candidatus Riflebacteria bacterium]|nr:polysaccharide deacetylase family protein [Candidatus Riflebacteria bacterium]